MLTIGEQHFSAKNKKDAVRPNMGRKTSSAIPPKLIVADPLNFIFTQCNVRFY